MTSTKVDMVLNPYQHAYRDLVADPHVFLNIIKMRELGFSSLTLVTTRTLLVEALANGSDGLNPIAKLSVVDDPGLRFDVMECANLYLRKYHFVSRVCLKHNKGTNERYIELKIVKR